MAVPHGMVQRLRDAGVPEETAVAVGEWISGRAAVRRDYELELEKLWDEMRDMRRRASAGVAFAGGMAVGAAVVVISVTAFIAGAG